MKTKFVASLLLACLSLGVSAANNPFAMPIASKQVTGTSFRDDWKFVAPVMSVTASGAVISVDISQIFNIDNITLGLYDSADNPLAIGLTSEGSHVNDVPLLAGSSYFKDTGDIVNASNGGFYVFTAIASPVIEPGTLALVSAALGVTGLVALRRTKPPRA